MPYKDKDQQRKAQHESYLRNKVENNARSLRGKRDHREFIQNFKRDKSCVDCGVVYPFYVMDYHHRDPSEKVDSLGRMTSRYGRKSIEAEIGKCDLLCANCHRERTHQQEQIRFQSR